MKAICQQEVNRLYPSIRNMAINAIAIRQLDIKNIIIMPIATHINMNPINFFMMSTDMREVVIILYAAAGVYTHPKGNSRRYFICYAAKRR